MSQGPGDVVSRNRILRALRPADLEPVLTAGELVEFTPGEVVYEYDEAVTHAYFPASGLLSILHRVDGADVEVATVGNEGMVGWPLLVAGGRYPGRCLSQMPGAGLRLPAGVFGRLAAPGTGFHDHLQSYVQTLLVQTAQNAACNLLHRVEQRCARWILTTHDRVEGDEFPLTQELLAQMLGVRRPSVSTAAGDLRRAGLIRYRRGWMTVVDRQGLLEAACGCYSVIRREIERADA